MRNTGRFRVLVHCVHKLERALISALASDAVTDEERGRILDALHGTRARDANLLSAHELEHINRLRELAKPIAVLCAV